MFVKTRLAADCITAIFPAAGLLPSDNFVSEPSSALCASLKTSTPSLISFHRIHEILLSQRHIFTVPAKCDQQNGGKRGRRLT